MSSIQWVVLLAELTALGGRNWENEAGGVAYRAKKACERVECPLEVLQYIPGFSL